MTRFIALWSPVVLLAASAFGQTAVDADAAARDFAAPGGVHALQQEREAPVVVESQQ